MKHTGDRRYNAKMGGNQSGGKKYSQFGWGKSSDVLMQRWAEINHRIKNIHSLGEEKVQRTSFKNKQQ